MATVFTVRASAGKRNFSASVLSENPLALSVKIDADPVRGEANRALLFGLENMLGCRLEILSGKTGRKKTLAADCTRDEIVRIIRENEAKTKKE